MPAAIGKMLSGTFSWMKTGMGSISGMLPGAERMTSVKNWATTPSRGRRFAMTAGAGMGGYATSSDDASMGEKFGRALGFAIGGGILSRRFDAAGSSLGKAATNFGEALTGNWQAAGPGRAATSYYTSVGKRMKATGKLANRSARSRGYSMIGESATEVGFLEGRGGKMQSAWGNMKEFGGISQWGAKQSIAAGALYGLISDDVGVIEGAVGGGIMHGGVKMGMSGVRAGRWGSPVAAYRGTAHRTFVSGAHGISVVGPKAGSFTAARKAFGRLPLARTGAGFGAAYGAYSSMGEGEGHFPGEMLAGAAGGFLKGGLVGGLAKAGTSHPLATFGILGTAGVAAGGAAEGYATWEASGRPGMTDLDADGDLALALHRVRKSY